MKASPLEALFEGILKRYTELTDSPTRQLSFIEHVKSLATWESDAPINPDYINENPARFPKEIKIAHAFCSPECGTIEFIVDGSTQECQRCGRLMFRNETHTYILK